MTGHIKLLAVNKFKNTTLYFIINFSPTIFTTPPLYSIIY
nr:MAG TPA: hypothetical protein [Caudoviricetes sp.]